ncbi:MAG: tRNA (5-methylaminomethyl-2-thiouridine)(34)-methyltransferase MnmD [Rhodobacteraceae bacterium]|nr:tRNA (5-methylaminomethyl-2-thiouridine)(34)-methyltransferase MnmD [Paracoccaceae bacterium]
MTGTSGATGEGLTWRGGVPVSARFGDPYFSLEDGLAESRHVFLAGNGLPGRFRDGFRIAETGFGTGLNFLAALAAWRAAGAPGRLSFTSFEAFPLAAGAAGAALAAFPALAGPAAELLARWDDLGAGATFAGGVTLTVIAGDARATLPRWEGTADAWFLDGFAPARNPELWEAPLLAEVARHTAPGGTFATYTAAGAVRRALAAAGFAVARLPGYGRKRHMTAGRLS